MTIEKSNKEKVRTALKEALAILEAPEESDEITVGDLTEGEFAIYQPPNGDPMGLVAVSADSFNLTSEYKYNSYSDGRKDNLRDRRYVAAGERESYAQAY